MPIGDALFARLSVRDFTRLSDGIADLQSRIASGKNDPRPSADVVRAADLSALRDRVARLDRADAAADAAAGRLALTDGVLGDMADAVRGWQQAALRLGDPGTDRRRPDALRAEVLSLWSRPTGRRKRDRRAGGSPCLQVPRRALPLPRSTVRSSTGATTTPRQVRPTGGPTLPAGISGADVAGPDVDGLFAGLADLALALRDPMRSARATATAEGTARLDVQRSRAGGEAGLTLTGPAGAARVQIDLRADAPGAAVDAINAASAETGITATLLPDGTGILLLSAGSITIGDQVGPAVDRPILQLAPAERRGHPDRCAGVGPPRGAGDRTAGRCRRGGRRPAGRGARRLWRDGGRGGARPDRDWRPAVATGQGGFGA